MPRGTDPDRLGSRRSAKDDDIFVPAPRGFDIELDEDDLEPMFPTRHRVVPGERSRVRGSNGWPGYDQLRGRKMAPFGVEDQDVLYTGKHDKRTPVIRQAEDEPWWVGRLGDLVPFMLMVVLALTLIGIIFIMLFTDWFDRVDVFFEWLSNIDGLNGD